MTLPALITAHHTRLQLSSFPNRPRNHFQLLVPSPFKSFGKSWTSGDNQVLCNMLPVNVTKASSVLSFKRNLFVLYLMTIRGVIDSQKPGTRQTAQQAMFPVKVKFN